MAQGAASPGTRKITSLALLRCTNRPERKALKLGFGRVAGLDEAGRGCLFGPVYAGAVILNPDRPIRGLRDSKQLAPERRQELAEKIRASALAWAVAWADNAEIDRLNIYQASRLAMRRALDGLSPSPDYLLVDALRLDTTIAQKALIHGDALSRSIAAASILAKVARDESMLNWDRLYPQYGFLHHKGYGTPEHLHGLAEHGVTPHHRFSFEPVSRQMAVPATETPGQQLPPATTPGQAPSCGLSIKNEAAGGSGQLSLFEEAAAAWT